MTVGELIEKLKNYDADLDVRIGYEDIENGDRTNLVDDVIGIHLGWPCNEDAVVLADCNFSGERCQPLKGNR